MVLERTDQGYVQSSSSSLPGYYLENKDKRGPTGSDPACTILSLTRSGRENRTTRRVSGPTRDILLQTPVAGPSTIEAEPYNDEPSAESLAVASQQGYIPDRKRQEDREVGLMESGNSNVNHSWNAVQPHEGPDNRGFGSEDLLGIEKYSTDDVERRQHELRRAVLLSGYTCTPVVC